MDKLQMAMRFAEIMLIEHFKGNGVYNSYGYKDGICEDAWVMADAMQAEADKRESSKCKTGCDEKIEINMYPEWDATVNYPPDAQVMYRGEKRLAVSIKEEWQPDWNQAPDDAIGWMIFDGVSTWLGESSCLIEDAPSFGLTGSHIVERPHDL